MSTFDPRIAGIPEDISEAVKNELGQSSLEFSRPADGTTGRTFIVKSDAGKHVLRLEEHSGMNLTRAISAIRLASKAGVAVPSIRAVGDENSSFFWYLEDFAAGSAFPHTDYDKKEIQDATIDLGRNLRRLHSIPLKQFGLLAPNPWVNWPTAADRYKSAAQKAERALSFAKVDLQHLPKILSAYQYVIALPASAACLCKADCRTTNLIIQQGRISAIIDWEWATGDLGASDIAAWHFSNRDPQALDLLLAGYVPDNEDAFRRQIAALIVIGIITEFGVLEEHVNFFTEKDRIDGLNERRSKLFDCLKAPGWIT